VILVVGATGQLGSAVVHELRKQNRQVRATIRDPDPGRDLSEAGAEVVTADLRCPESWDAALAGVTAVVATANVNAPTHRGDDDAALAKGYAELIDRAQAAGVSRFVYVSVPETPLDDAVAMVRSKRQVERRLAASTMSTITVRMPPFTEVWLALAGSTLPLRGEPRATVTRPYPFLQRFRALTGSSVERRGVMVVPGRATNRNAFLSLHDAARVLAALVDAPEVRGAVDIGGPEVLTWNDVARTFAEVLGRPVRVRSTPVAVFTVASWALSRVAPSASNVLGLNRILGIAETPWDTAETTRRLGVHPLRTVEQILREKAALPAETVD
jgi:uncharacterized protein YbjT (DUF2867 family)